MSPSSIQFLPGLECQEDAEEILNDENVKILVKTLDADSADAEYKKVLQVKLRLSLHSTDSNSNVNFQATQISGTWFALNSALLLMYKVLQRKGKLNTVAVEKVRNVNNCFCF